MQIILNEKWFTVFSNFWETKIIYQSFYSLKYTIDHEDRQFLHLICVKCDKNIWQNFFASRSCEERTKVTVRGTSWYVNSGCNFCTKRDKKENLIFGEFSRAAYTLLTSRVYFAKKWPKIYRCFCRSSLYLRICVKNIWNIVALHILHT